MDTRKKNSKSVYSQSDYNSNMKLFQTMQRYSKAIGFDRNCRPFNEIALIVFGIFGFEIISYVTYLYTKVNSFKEYNNSVYCISTTMLIADCFTTISVQMLKAFETIDRFEETIEKSKFSNHQTHKVIKKIS